MLFTTFARILPGRFCPQAKSFSKIQKIAFKKLTSEILFAVNKRKILNDPVYGFITLPDELIFELINHSCFQRLTRIRQLGLTYLVYPGALHTRFNHAIGAMHLMGEALDILRQKGTEISPNEKRAALAAILLHDIGHGPFSHALENSLIHNVSHEVISLKLMELLNGGLKGELDEAISIFRNQHPKKFLHQLVSSQLDVDRLDYLSRDSFFTGVSEGVIGTERILKMMTIVNDDLAVEEKGIYSVEKFIIARRLMYWQVYYHKTVVAAEQMLISILRRAHKLALEGNSVFAPPALAYFLENQIDETRLDAETLRMFMAIDDSDIISSIKVWQQHPDRVLSMLSIGLVNRRLFRAELSNESFSAEYVAGLRNSVAKSLGLSSDEAAYFVSMGEIQNNTYTPGIDKILISFRGGIGRDITEASDQFSQNMISKNIVKHFLSWPKGV
ncbi:MAG: phosphohydrolase [Bacteroidetes bacterium HGW-Bacteroidetes-6]|jgi:hypothetical protein|nr:MAG: phosphohydrolase [Bacteroidetes bacterium HGW-Bacteroidetes-6]